MSSSWHSQSQGAGKRPERNPLDEIEAQELQRQQYMNMFVIDQKVL